ncbi:MAG: YceI family protein [Chloroflexi bacterium]|nr:YceI family protein [Chloroflexota bacterium]
MPERSAATIRVREQVANVPAPGDAILSSRAFSGGFVMLPDGTFTEDSTIAIDLDALASDSSLRDEWIKINTLQTRRFPRAEFTAQKVAGVPLPLPTAGEWPAQLRGVMRIHGVDRELTWPLVVTRSGAEVQAKGATTFRFGDHGMAVPADRMILSVVDEIRLEVDITARAE